MAEKVNRNKHDWSLGAVFKFRLDFDKGIQGTNDHGDYVRYAATLIDDNGSEDPRFFFATLNKSLDAGMRQFKKGDTVSIEQFATEGAKKGSVIKEFKVNGKHYEKLADDTPGPGQPGSGNDNNNAPTNAQPNNSGGNAPQSRQGGNYIKLYADIYASISEALKIRLGPDKIPDPNTMTDCAATIFIQAGRSGITDISQMGIGTPAPVATPDAAQPQAQAQTMSAPAEPTPAPAPAPQEEEVNYIQKVADALGRLYPAHDDMEFACSVVSSFMKDGQLVHGANNPLKLSTAAARVIYDKHLKDKTASDSDDIRGRIGSLAEAYGMTKRVDTDLNQEVQKMDEASAAANAIAGDSAMATTTEECPF